jgi:nucleoside-diphosphate-sugar epimerase
MTRHAVVTGGAGFLGSHLTEALLGRGWAVTVVDDLSSGTMLNLAAVADDPALTVVVADICGEWQVTEPVDLVLNFASLASPPAYLANPLHSLAAGSVGVQHVIDLAVRSNARLIHASTSEVYGDPEEHPQHEEYWGRVNPIGPRSVYDEAKRFAEALIAAHVRLGTVDAGIVRIFNTYGPRLGAGDGRVISNFIGQALRGEALTVYGNGQQTRSFCYVDDLVAGVLAMAESRGLFGPINLGNPAETTIFELARLVSELTCVPHQLAHFDLPVDDPTRRRPSVVKAARHLAWRPVTDLRTGLERTIAWFRTEQLAPEGSLVGQT